MLALYKTSYEPTMCLVHVLTLHDIQDNVYNIYELFFTLYVTILVLLHI